MGSRRRIAKVQERADMHLRPIVAVGDAGGGDAPGERPGLVEDVGGLGDLVGVAERIAPDDYPLAQSSELGVERQAMNEVEPAATAAQHHRLDRGIGEHPEERRHEEGIGRGGRPLSPTGPIRTLVDSSRLVERIHCTA